MPLYQAKKVSGHVCICDRGNDCASIYNFSMELCGIFSFLIVSFLGNWCELNSKPAWIKICFILTKKQHINNRTWKIKM